MKKTIILLVCMIFSAVIIAQEKPSFIGLSLGPSFPTAGFHSKELPEGGFALTGLDITLEGAWFFKPWIGAGGSACMNLHPVDAGALGSAKLAGNPYMTSLIIRSDPWLSLSLNAGLYFRFPLTEKISFTAKATGGVIYGRTPYQLYKAEYYMIGKNWYEVTSAGDYEASFLAGGGLRYDLNDHIGFSLQGDFTYNVMDFNFITSDGTVRTDEIVMSFVNLGAGIVYKIVRKDY